MVSPAGAFGNYVRKESATSSSSLLPIAEKDKIISVGGAARMRTRMALLCPIGEDRALRVAATTQYVELSGNVLDFQMEVCRHTCSFPAPVDIWTKYNRLRAILYRN